MNQWLNKVAGLGLLALLATGCERDGIKVYKVATDDQTPSAPAAPAAPPGMPPSDMTIPPAAAQTGGPQLQWTLPAGWTQKAAEGMRLGSFSAPGKDGQIVDISIVPLAGMAGGDLMNVNRWRGQVGLSQITEEQLAKEGQDVTVGDSTARLYDMAGTIAGATGPGRILAVGLHRADMMWFFKATGDDVSVESQKDNFIAFLKSIQFAPPDAAALPADHPDVGAGAPAMTAPVAETAVNSPGLPTWTVPAGWQSAPPSQMLLAKFTVAENSQQADITVTSFPGDVGGLLANVNRWRGQISLPPLDDTSLPGAITALTTPAGPASTVDFTGTSAKTGQPARMVGVILPLNGQTWFYKLMGDPAVVDHQRAAFRQFVQSVKY